MSTVSFKSQIDILSIKGKNPYSTQNNVKVFTLGFTVLVTLYLCKFSATLYFEQVFGTVILKLFGFKILLHYYRLLKTPKSFRFSNIMMCLAY